MVQKCLNVICRQLKETILDEGRSVEGCVQCYFIYESEKLHVWIRYISEFLKYPSNSKVLIDMSQS